MTNPYDELPWRGQPIDGTAPEQLAAASWLQGGPRPDVFGCRVLEVGCGDGANLLPMAWFRPECRFVGVDASAVALATAAEGVGALGLRNVDLVHARVEDLSLGDEPFDYVIAPGLWSWIAPTARDALLALCGRHLDRDGLALISFNVAPGWVGRSLVRDAMRKATRGMAAPIERARRARAVASTLHSLVTPEDSPYAALLHAELRRLARADDAYVEHEYLAEENAPAWFGDFADQAARHGLVAFGDARFNRPEALPARGWAERVARLGDLGLAPDDTVDLLGGRQFRHALVARRDSHPADPDACFRASTIATALARASDPFDLSADRPERFHVGGGGVIEVTDPKLKWALVHLASIWPRGQSIDQLVAPGRPALEAADVRAEWTEPALSEFGNAFAELAREGWVELRLREPRSGTPLAASPRVLPITTWEAARGGPLTTPFHVVMPLDPAERDVILDLDEEPGHPPHDGAHALLERLGRWGLVADDP